MNEAIEVLADQVEEENVVSYWKINTRKNRRKMTFCYKKRKSLKERHEI